MFEPSSYDLTGIPFLIKKRPVKVDEQLSEILDDRLGLRHVLTRVRNIATGERLLLKIPPSPRASGESTPQEDSHEER